MSSHAARDPAHPAVVAFVESDTAYRDGIQALKALERARDDALLVASREMSLEELTTATGLSKDRALRMINRARRASATWSLRTFADRRWTPHHR